MLKYKNEILKLIDEVFETQLDSMEKVKSAFEILKEGGKVTMELQETFWSKYFGSVEDKFGVNWLLSIVEDEN